MHKWAVNPVTETVSKNGKSDFDGILIVKSYPAKIRLNTVCIITNQKSIQVRLKVRVSNFVAIAVAAKQMGRRNAAINAQLTTFKSGLATSIIPTKSDLPFLFIVSVTGLTAHLCMTKAFSLAPVSVVMPIDFVRLPLISVVGYLFYNEVLTWYVVLGSVLVFLGNYINIKAEERGQSYERISGSER